LGKEEAFEEGVSAGKSKAKKRSCTGRQAMGEPADQVSIDLIEQTSSYNKSEI
jgi:hypothetical protein